MRVLFWLLAHYRIDRATSEPGLSGSADDKIDYCSSTCRRDPGTSDESG